MPTLDPIRIVEAAYRWHPREHTWLEGIAEAASPYAVGGGVFAVTLRCKSTSGIELGRFALSSGVDGELVRAVAKFCRSVRPATGKLLFAPTEFAGNASWRVARLATSLGTSVEALAGGAPLPPLWAVVGGAPAKRSIFLGFLAKRGSRVAVDAPFPNDHSRVLGLVGAHLGSALRLRALGPSSADARAADAVLSPAGRVLHAAGDATAPRMRESLAQAVLRSERARGRLRRLEPTQATELWSALVQGQWSIVETSERDGKRFLIARRNALGERDLLKLTPAENDVVWLAAQGHSLKYMAYELGLSLSTVTRRLTSAMRKLRVGSRRELIGRLGSAARPESK